MMVPGARQAILNAIDLVASERGEEKMVKVLRALSEDSDFGTFMRGVIQMLPSAPPGVTGEEIRSVCAGRLAELEARR